MNDNFVRALFEDAIGSEPTSAPLADEDIARGRALRARRLRRRVGGIGIGATALVAAALTVPASPLSLVDGSNATQPATSAGSVPLARAVANDPLLMKMWKAVEKVLPADAQLAEGTVVDTWDQGMPVISFMLEDGSSVVAMLQESRPDMEEFRPCSDPPLRGAWGDGGGCHEERDEQGRWRISSYDDLATGMSVLEGGTAAAIVRWASVDGFLSNEEADTIAEAVWAVGAEHDEAELSGGIDLAATLDAWPQIHAALKNELDADTLTPVKPDDPAAIGGTYDEERGVVVEIDETDQSGLIAARYRTSDDELVDVIVYQKNRAYDTFCHPRIRGCDILPRTSTYLDNGAKAALGGDNAGFTAPLGLRAGIYVNDGTEAVGGTFGLADLVPLLGDRTHPDLDKP